MQLQPTNGLSLFAVPPAIDRANRCGAGDACAAGELNGHNLHRKQACLGI